MTKEISAMALIENFIETGDYTHLYEVSMAFEYAMILNKSFHRVLSALVTRQNCDEKLVAEKRLEAKKALEDADETAKELLRDKTIYI